MKNNMAAKKSMKMIVLQNLMFEPVDFPQNCYILIILSIQKK